MKNQKLNKIFNLTQKNWTHFEFLFTTLTPMEEDTKKTKKIENCRRTQVCKHDLLNTYKED